MRGEGDINVRVLPDRAGKTPNLCFILYFGSKCRVRDFPSFLLAFLFKKPGLTIDKTEILRARQVPPWLRDWITEAGIGFSIVGIQHNDIFSTIEA